jgi:Protein of unknown function (DUF2726)
MDLRLIGTILAGIALLAGVVWFFARRSRPSSLDNPADRLDTVGGWPPQATRILTTAERLALDVLVRALPEYMVLAQVPLARFLKVPTRNSYVEWLRRLGNQCADLVVCDKATQVIAVVDVQVTADRASERSRKRLNRMARVLKAAQIPLHVWTEGSLPSVDAARATLLPKPAVQEEAPAQVGAVPPVRTVSEPSVASPSPFDEPDRDSTSDEIIEAREPPPSTWFDEFNSGPTPLGKPKKK